MPQPLTICLDQAATHVDVGPGEEIILRGSFQSKHDGSTVDAALTTWPGDAPGGASVDSGGLVDLTGGGFHMTSRDPVTHEVHAVATGQAAPVCDALQVKAPCLPLRIQHQARTRLITIQEWKQTLIGGSPGAPGCLAMEVPSHVLPAVAPSTAPYLQAGAAAMGLLAVIAIGWVGYRRRQASPMGQLLVLAARVQAKVKTADPVLRATLAPAIETAQKALRSKRVDASSAEGKRVSEVLRRVEAQINETEAKARAEEEKQAADELVQELESALEAADEAGATGQARRAS